MVVTHRWPLINDAPLIHYVIFLMDHGRAPYRDIVEMNMPGSYMLEWLVMHILGGGAGGWWLWDSLSGVVEIASCMWIAGRRKKAAGATAGALAYLVHLTDGPKDFGQRDWIVAVLLGIATGCLFTAIRQRRPIWLTGAMGFCVLAASIKPPVMAVAIVFLIAAVWVFGKSSPHVAKGSSALTYGPLFLWSALGASIAIAPTMLFLERWGITHDFFSILHGLVPWYAGVGRRGLLTLIFHAPSPQLLPLFIGAFSIFVLNRSWKKWELNLLLTVTIVCAGLFVIQGKGWAYHRYPEVLIGTLWGMLELDSGLRATRTARLVAVATLAIMMIGAVPYLFHTIYRKPINQGDVPLLTADLNSLGGQSLSGKIQCLDMTNAACINVLYQMKLMQSTGFIYDFYLFPKHNNLVTEPLQSKFLAQVTAHPPRVIVLSAHTWPDDIYSYDQVHNWPLFESFLEQNYHLYREQPSQPHQAGYKVLVLNSKG